jgi:3-deoxy-manno-octulosonate cytidylyltransferase (CMP-KDO synthetase)
MSDFHVIIPVRLASTRLHGKSLKDIGGKPMIQHVYERALLSKAKSVVIATDDETISEVSTKFGAKVCMTSTKHQSGTDRIAEASDLLDLDEEEIIVNIQGDEPLIDPIIINQAAEDLDSQEYAEVSTLCEPIVKTEDLFDPNIVKAILDQDGYALYFSRAPIPWNRDKFSLAKQDYSEPLIFDCYYKHIGIYAYRVGFLQEYVTWKPCMLEIIERLEQLRMLFHGVNIFIGLAKGKTGIGVDTPEDLEKVRKIISEKL